MWVDHPVYHPLKEWVFTRPTGSTVDVRYDKLVSYCLCCACVDRTIQMFCRIPKKHRVDSSSTVIERDVGATVQAGKDDVNDSRPLPWRSKSKEPIVHPHLPRRMPRRSRSHAPHRRPSAWPPTIDESSRRQLLSHPCPDLVRERASSMRWPTAK